MCAPAPVHLSSRIHDAGEWLLVLGLMATIAWTTLCLGGYLAQTMVVTSTAVFVLAALGGLLFALRPQRFNRAALLPLPFLLYALASVMWLAPAPWLAWREWLLWLQMWLVFVLVLHFGRSRAASWLIIGTFLALGIVGVGMAAYQRFVSQTWMMMGKVQVAQFADRSAGMFGIPNSLAGLLELMIPACGAIVFSRTTSALVKVLCSWLAAMFLFALVLTGSRGGWIALSVTLAIWPLLGGENWSRRLTGLVTVTVLVTAVAVGLYKFSPPVHNRLQPFLAGKFESSRPIIWRVAVNIWQDHPWLGSGAGSYNTVFEQYRPKHFLNEPHWTHNDYLNTLSDYGAVGFALWTGAGAGLAWVGWQSVRRARQASQASGQVLLHWRLKLGFFLGLTAFALHLGVDFHTKIPALAYAAAVAMALLLRLNEEAAVRRRGGIRWLGLNGAFAVLAVAWFIASPLYRAESLRYTSRHTMDVQAREGKGDLRDILPQAVKNIERATLIDPRNGQAWADYAHAVMLTWYTTGGDIQALGMVAERAVDRAIALCPVQAEFWLRKGAAQDMQGKETDSGRSYHRALELAPQSADVWYYYAYHLSLISGQEMAALQAIKTCLELDPSISVAVALKERLMSKH